MFSVEDSLVMAPKPDSVGPTPPDQQGGLESGGKDNTKQTNELLLRAL